MDANGGTQQVKCRGGAVGWWGQMQPFPSASCWVQPGRRCSGQQHGQYGRYCGGWAGFVSLSAGLVPHPSNLATRRGSRGRQGVTLVAMEGSYRPLGKDGMGLFGMGTTGRGRSFSVKEGEQ